MVDYSNAAVWQRFLRERNLPESPPPPSAYEVSLHDDEGTIAFYLEGWAHSQRFDQSDMYDNYAHIIALAEAAG